MSKKPTMNRQSSQQPKKSNTINTLTSLSRATSYNSSDNKKTIIESIYSDDNKQGLPKISKMPGLHRNHPAIKPKKPKTKKKESKSPRAGKNIKKGGKRKRTRKRSRRRKRTRKRSRRRKRTRRRSRRRR